MGSRKFTLASVIVIFTLSFESAPAQHVQILSDQQWIELGIDLLRKGIQEEDTMKINMALAPDVSVNGEKGVASSQIVQKFQMIFSGSSDRTMRLARPTFSRSDSPRHNSDFWDFDILGPKRTITGDTAVVECEIVLWAAPPDGINRGPGRKVKERLVFVSPLPHDLKNAAVSTENKPWPNGPFEHNPENSRKSWKLSKFEKIFQFLETGVRTEQSSKTRPQEEK